MFIKFVSKIGLEVPTVLNSALSPEVNVPITVFCKILALALKPHHFNHNRTKF